MAFLAMSFFVSIRVRAVTNDFYTTLAGTLLSVPAPGVLTNDGKGSLTAILTAAPANGTALLNTNGSFTYTPATNFNGMDGFAYVVTNAVKGTSAVAAADIMVSSPGEAFYDNFWRPANNGPIFPYTQVSDKKFVQGTWGISNGLMNGSSPTDTYGYLYYENSKWSDYSVQAQVQFSSISAASAGIFGRLNPTNGAHYAVWIYPEDSTEQYSPENGTAVLLLIKYKNWTNYTLIGGTVPLTGIGTNWHTLRLMFQQKTNIFAYFDGALVDSATDNGKIDGKAAYTGGGIGLNLWTLAGHPYTFSVNNLIVSTNASVVANGDTYNATNGETLSVSAPGILANDIGNGTNGVLSALLVNGPTNGNLTLAADGSFTYLATNNSATNDSFTYQATDGQTISSVTTVTFNINIPPPAPVILSCGLTNQIFTIEWSSVSNATYALQFTSDLTGGVWSNISPNLLAAGATMTETNAIGDSSQGFYRVVLLTN